MKREKKILKNSEIEQVLQRFKEYILSIPAPSISQMNKKNI